MTLRKWWRDYRDLNLWKATCKAWVRKSYMHEEKLYEKCGEIGTLEVKLAVAEARIKELEERMRLHETDKWIDLYAKSEARIALLEKVREAAVEHEKFFVYGQASGADLSMDRLCIALKACEEK